MKMSQLFSKTLKDAPKDEVAKNAEFLTRGGFVNKLSSGVYTYLPLGLRVLKKIEDLIRKEMNALGAQELLMPSLVPKENWEKTGRWSSIDDLYKLEDARGREIGLAPTHEEVIVPLAGQFVSSYKDLPFSLYQFQNKFRMELRAKSGLLRGREFLMKDLYSFHANEEDLALFYEKVKDVYVSIFRNVGIGDTTYITYASGGTFSKYSHEFQTLTPAGEDTVFICPGCSIGINKEIIDDQKNCPTCAKDEFEEKCAIEVGNIFELKTRFSDAFGLTYKDESGKENPVIMGCYGIGLGRLMGAVAEVSNDEKGIIWPESIAPFSYHLIVLGEDSILRKKADDLYLELTEKGKEVLYDDRDVSPGVKFKDADLIGIPRTLIVSEKTIKEGDSSEWIETKDRKTGALKMCTPEDCT